MLVYVCVFFCNVWVCVCVDFVMCGCVYVWVLKSLGFECVGFVMCGVMYVCMVSLMCGCVYALFW